MKKKIVSFILIGTVLGLGLSTVLFSPKKAVIESRGYSTSSLPTTIDLNATSASNIRSYYSSLNNLSTSERQGTNLLKNLKTILKNGQKYYSYDSGSAIWQIYEITDRDWDKSPASSTTYGTYNSSTNKITNYTYGTSASNSKNNPYIHALYINRNVTNQTTAWDDHQQTEWGINREHVWPKAEGFEGSGDGGARGDPMHLMAGNGYSNNIHSNYYYGYVDTSSSYTNCGTKYSNQEGNLRGNSKTLGGTTSVFEPQDCDKGDIARAIFYMVARYNYLSNSDSDGIDQNNPNLTLTQSLSDWSSSSYCSSTSETGKMGIMTDLLAWHHADPVDEYEIRRNNLLYTNYTNNRNPFIDFPQWVDFIWGTATYNGNSYQSYSSTPTGYATPSSDTINGYNSGSSISVTGVSLNKTSMSLIVGNTETLTATVAPSNASNKTVTWSSSNTSVATVSNGLVTAKKAGNATITVTTADGNKKATCSVTVTNATKTLSSISISGQKTEYSLGDEFVKPTVTAHFSDSSTSNVTSNATFGGFDSSTPGNQTITVEYTYGGVTKTTTYVINVSSLNVKELSGSITVSSGSFTGWESEGLGSAYGDGSAKLDSAGDRIFKLDLFSGNVSAQMMSLTVTINGKCYTSNNASPGNNSYKVDAVSGTASSMIVKDSLEKTGSDVFTTSYADVSFELNNNLNGTTGFCITYSNKVSGNFGIQSISWVVVYNDVYIEPTSLTASVNHQFYVGETIKASDIFVENNLGTIITDFAFNQYTFTYEDTPGGGDSVFEKDFEIEYEGLEANFSVDVLRKPHENLNTLYEHTGSEFRTAGIKTSYTTGQTAIVDGITFAVDGYVYSTNISISSGSSSAPGSIKNTTPYPGGITNVVIEGASPDIQLSTNGSNWVDLSSASVDSNYYYYLKIYFKNTAQSGYVNISNIKVTMKEYETVDNLSNYIMFEDTNNQCFSKFSVAQGYFEKLAKNQRTEFMTSNDYVVSTARTRLEAWANSLGKVITLSNGDYVISNSKNSTLNVLNVKNENMPVYAMIVALAFGSGTIICLFIIKRRRAGR